MPAPSEQLGQVGAYTKIKAVGKGSFGTVYLVRRSSSDGRSVGDQMMIMKEISLKGMPPKERHATKKEVELLNGLEHANIIAYIDSFCQKDTLFIVMEYASEGDLASLIAKRKLEKRRFSETEVLTFAWQLVSAMAHCHHDRHMLHRDLKPQNVFLGREGIKLGDFGLAKVLAASQALAITQCGTPLYMSPELCAGDSYGRPADVWAIGCIIYELMSLRAPWVDKGGAMGLRGLMKLIQSSTLDLSECRKHYSAELCNLLATLLARTPAGRPSLKALLEAPILKSSAAAHCQRLASARPPSTAASAPRAVPPSAAPSSRPPSTPAARPPSTPVARPPSSRDRPSGPVSKQAAAQALQRSIRKRVLAPVPESAAAAAADPAQPAGNRARPPAHVAPSIWGDRQRPPSAGDRQRPPSADAARRARPTCLATPQHRNAAAPSAPNPAANPKADPSRAAPSKLPLVNAKAGLAAPPPSRPATGLANRAGMGAMGFAERNNVVLKQAVHGAPRRPVRA